jgi:hypothetical protein
LKKKLKTSILFCFDEIDKLSKRQSRRSVSALIEVLDPEQNNLHYDTLKWVMICQSHALLPPPIIWLIQLAAETGWNSSICQLYSLRKSKIARQHLFQ